jgi:hypothetical protein
MNRQLSCLIARGGDSAVNLAAELVQHGFIHPQVQIDFILTQVQHNSLIHEYSTDIFIHR